MSHRTLVAITDSSSIGVGDIPQCAGHILLPVVYSVVVYVAGVLDSCRIGLSGVNHSIAVDVLLAVVELVAICVVISWIGGLGRVTVRAVDLDAVRDAVAVGVDGGRVSQQYEGLVRVVQTVSVSVVVVGVGLGDAVNLGGENDAAAWPETKDWITRRFRRGHVEWSWPEVLSRRVGRAVTSPPSRIDVLPQITKAISVGITICAVHVGV